MNQVTDLRADLAQAVAALAAHHTKYYWCKGYGTGWKGSHYGISQEEYDAAYARNTDLRGRILAIQADIERRTKPRRMKSSGVAHKAGLV